MILRFRHLLEKHGLGEQIFEIVKAHVRARGMKMRQFTIVDATLIAAPTSTKNKQGERDPEMHQTNKGNQWYFGMKVHIGVDKDSGLIHSAHPRRQGSGRALLYGVLASWSRPGRFGVSLAFLELASSTPRCDIRQLLVHVYPAGCKGPSAERVKVF